MFLPGKVSQVCWRHSCSASSFPDPGFGGIGPLLGNPAAGRRIIAIQHRHEVVDQVKREAALRWGEERRLVGMPVINGHREPIEPMGEGRSSGFRPIEFFRYRRGGSNGGGAFSFELEFEESVSGPIAMGFACHYGLGFFVPAW